MYPSILSAAWADATATGSISLMDYQTRICKEYLRSYDKPKRPQRTLKELSANFDLQERNYRWAITHATNRRL